MNAGDKTPCPHCGQRTFAKKKVIIEGWVKKGEILICPLCTGKLADCCTINADASATESGAEKMKTAALAGLLKVTVEQNPQWHENKDERHFCRDCLHFIVHPFFSRCDKLRKEVNPMDDCPQFINKKTDKKKQFE